MVLGPSSRPRAHGVLELADLLGGPGGQGLGLRSFGAATLRQQVGDRLNVKQGHDVAAKGRAEVANEAGRGRHARVAVLRVLVNKGDWNIF